MPPSGEDFVLCLPRGDGPPREGPLLAATAGTSVLVAGSSAPEAWFPESPGVPFLLEVSIAGEVVEQMAFPDAMGPEVMAVANDGSIFLAGQDRPNTSFGEVHLPDVEDGYYLLKLSPSLDVLEARMVSSAFTQLNVLHADSEGDVVLATAVVDFESGSGHPVITKFDGSALVEAWSTAFDHDAMPALAYGLTSLPDGRVVAAGLFSRTLTVGTFVLEKPPEVRDDDSVYSGWVAWLSPSDGRPVLAESFYGTGSSAAWAVAATASGDLRLLSSHEAGTVRLFGSDEVFDDMQNVLIEVNAEGTEGRLSPLNQPDGSGSKIALGSAGQTYVAGRYGDPLGPLDMRGARISRVETDGALGETLNLSTGYGATQLAVDGDGGVWIGGISESPFEWNDEVHSPDPGSDGDDSPGCHFVLRASEF